MGKKLTKRVTFKPQEGGGWVVYQDGERIGFIRRIEKSSGTYRLVWLATDSELRALPGQWRLKASAVAALQRRATQEDRTW